MRLFPEIPYDVWESLLRLLPKSTRYYNVLRAGPSNSVSVTTTVVSFESPVSRAVVFRWP